MKLFNSLTKKLTELNRKEINLYACGPTVYNYIHIGNARAVITVDLLVNLLEYQGIKVNYLQNYTDIDDKIINKALEQNKTEEEISKIYIDAFEKDVAALNIRFPDQFLPISKYIPDIIQFIQTLIANDSAYVVKGNVYFRINNYANLYGKLSNKVIEELESGARIDVDENKEHAMDFVLWKKTNIGILFDSPWGKGRPGWHTECSLLIDKFFNQKTIDIHAGGIDLIFPHHENERIQYYAKNGREIAKIWLHNGHLNIENEKMSKSTGNIITLRDFIDQYGANTLRYLLYTTNYTHPLNITDEIISFAHKEAKKIFSVLKTINLYLVEHDLSINSIKPGKYIKEVINLLNHNLNTANVLTLLNEMSKLINIQVREKKLDLTTANDYFEIVLKILNFNFELPLITNEIREFITKWNEFKAKNNYIEADQIRDILMKMNVL